MRTPKKLLLFFRRERRTGIRILRNLHLKIGSKKSHSLHLFFAWRPAINKLILGVLYGLSFSNHSIAYTAALEYYSLLLISSFLRCCHSQNRVLRNCSIVSSLADFRCSVKMKTSGKFMTWAMILIYLGSLENPPKYHNNITLFVF